MDHRNHLLLCFLSILLCWKCQRPATDLTAEFILKPGFEIDLVASEPLVLAPMAMTFDGKGRIWVVEMPGYMRDINGSEEDFPDGRIVILEDQDGDGQMDTRKVFLDGLRTPRALAFAYGGLLYTETPNLYWVPVEGDQPGQHELVDSLYVIGGNIEHQPNGLIYGLDNWFYSAKSNVRYQRRGSKWIKELTTFRGQWGIAQDNHGRLFYNNNSTPLECDQLWAEHLTANRFLDVDVAGTTDLDPDRRMHPFQATSVNRGYKEGVLDSTGRVQRFTSACGPVVYRGEQFPVDAHGNAFVCGPEANLIKRYLIAEEDGAVTAKPAHSDSEFLVSRDESFRPINLYTGLDGALYIVDLRKGIIQHRAYMTSYLRDRIVEKGLDTLPLMGRLYKVTATHGSARDVPRWHDLTQEDYVTLLGHANGAVRDWAQQQLVFGNHKALEREIRSVALNGDNPWGQVHALWTLDGLDLLDVELLMQLSEVSKEPIVWRQMLRLATDRIPASQLHSMLLTAKSFGEPVLDLLVCHLSGGEGDHLMQLWLEMAKTHGQDPLYMEALVTGIAGREQDYLRALSAVGSTDLLSEKIAQTLDHQRANDVQLRPLPTKAVMDGRTRGAHLYSVHCASCHGPDGRGVDGLAPPLYGSQFVTESAEKLVALTLNGLEGPVTVAGTTYEMNLVMPGIRNNPTLSDDDIARILKFVGNGFNVGSPSVSTEMVKAVRSATRDRSTLFTVETLDQWWVSYTGQEAATAGRD